MMCCSYSCPTCCSMDLLEQERRPPSLRPPESFMGKNCTCVHADVMMQIQTHVCSYAAVVVCADLSCTDREFWSSTHLMNEEFRWSVRRWRTLPSWRWPAREQSELRRNYTRWFPTDRVFLNASFPLWIPVGSLVRHLRSSSWTRRIPWPTPLRRRSDARWRKSLEPLDSVSSATTSAGQCERTNTPWATSTAPTLNSCLFLQDYWAFDLQMLQVPLQTAGQWHSAGASAGDLWKGEPQV